MRPERSTTADAYENARRHHDEEKDYSRDRLPQPWSPSTRIGYLLTRPIGRPPNEVRRSYANFTYQAGSWTKPRRVVAKVEWHAGELYPRVGFIVTNVARRAENVVAFYNKRGTCEQWIKEGKGRSGDRGCRAARSRPTPCVCSFMRSPRPPFRLPEVTVAVRTLRLSAHSGRRCIWIGTCSTASLMISSNACSSSHAQVGRARVKRGKGYDFQGFCSCSFCIPEPCYFIGCKRSIFRGGVRGRGYGLRSPSISLPSGPQASLRAEHWTMCVPSEKGVRRQAGRRLV